MKSMIAVALALVAVAAALPVENSVPQTIQEKYEKQPNGEYVFEFETNNGIFRKEEAFEKEVLDEENKPVIILVVRGLYNYFNAEGVQETIHYTADESGYHAEGPAVPQRPARR